MSKDPLLDAFPNYVQLFKQVDRELARTPSWRFIRYNRLLNQLHRINKLYAKWFEAWQREHPAAGRQALTMEVPKHFDAIHFKAVTRAGRKFVYCPVGNICSWHPGDYDNRYCPWCKQYFTEVSDIARPEKKQGGKHA